MKYKGNVHVIEEIERLITSQTRHEKVKEGGFDGKQFQVLGGKGKSLMFCRRYLVSLNSTLKVVVKLDFDYRILGRESEIHIKDEKVWMLAVAVKGFCEQMSKLRPDYVKRRQGDFVDAVDRLVR